jgi:hypothetical protein
MPMPVDAISQMTNALVKITPIRRRILMLTVLSFIVLC